MGLFPLLRVFGTWMVRNYAGLASGYVIADLFNLFSGDRPDDASDQAQKGLIARLKNWLASFGIGNIAASFLLLFGLFYLYRITSRKK